MNFVEKEIYMPIKIGIIEENLLSPLYHNYENIKEKYNIELYSGSGDYISQLYKKGQLDIILVDPISFGKLTGEAENQIIPTHCLALESHTQKAHLEFNPEAKNVDSIYYAQADEYFGLIARILLAERYNSFPNLVKDAKDSDVQVKRGEAKQDSVSMDLSEIWFDTYEFPLVMGLWVCRKDLEKCDPSELTKALFNSELSDEKPVVSVVKGDGFEYEAEGNLHYKWTEDIAQSLSQMMELFFMSQIIDKVPQISENDAVAEANIVCGDGSSCEINPSDVSSYDDYSIEEAN